MGNVVATTKWYERVYLILQGKLFSSKVYPMGVFSSSIIIDIIHLMWSGKSSLENPYNKPKDYCTSVFMLCITLEFHHSREIASIGNELCER